MKQTRSFTSLLALALLMSAALACSLAGETGVTSPPPGGEIKLGNPVDLMTANLDAGGGTLTVDKPGDPLDGLQLSVPPGSYPDSHPFKISYAPIENHSFGEDFNPITPMISVDNGGTYADEIMEVKIPVKVPADYFAMGFIYDGQTQTLEGLPLIAQDADSITVGTRHFTNFLISMIPKVKLKTDIDTHFRPGIDDWQFTNRGSYIAPSGHCAGQSISAMWYYDTQPDGKDLTLYNRYDNNGDQPATPDLWQDDSLGYRLASSVQVDIDWDSFAAKFWSKQRGVNDESAWNLFAYSMQLTEEPQYVGMTSNSGPKHAMIAYRIKDGQLYVADPNYPGNTDRRIAYTNNHFAPYNSGLNRDDIDAGITVTFEKIGYSAKSTLVDWDKVAQRWAEFKAGTIGNDRFPTYNIYYLDDDGLHPVSDGMVITESPAYFLPDNFITVDVYRDGQLLTSNDNHQVALEPGANRLGFWLRKNRFIDNIEFKQKYVDFKYLTVMYEPAESTPTDTLDLTPEATLAPTEQAACPSGSPGQATTKSDSFGDPGDAFLSYSISGADLSQDPPGDFRFEGYYTGGPINLSGKMSVDRTNGMRSYVTMHAYIGDQTADWPAPGEDSAVEGRAVSLPYNLTYNPPQGHDCSPIMGGVRLDVCGGACGVYEVKFVVTFAVPPTVTPGAPSPTITILPSPTSTSTSTPTPTATAVSAATPGSIPAATPGSGTVEEIFKITSIHSAHNGATTPTTFTISETWLITEIRTYHWNDGQGVTPGLLGLMDENSILGPWDAIGEPGSGGVPNAYWVATPNIVIGPGTYRVLDSDVDTWSQNDDTAGRGMAWVYGIRQD